ncbi:hypothetical protein Tco_0034187 [Tanacetum coccineum]
MSMTIQSSVKDKILATLSETSKGMILEAQSEALKQENVLAERLHGLDQQMERKEDEILSPVIWAEIGESSLTGPELVLDTTDKVVLIKEKLKAARDRQKSYADKRRKPLEFEVGDRVLLKVSPWKGVNSKRGPEFTRKREDYMKSKYPQLFVDRADESAS